MPLNKNEAIQKREKIMIKETDKILDIMEIVEEYNVTEKEKNIYKKLEPLIIYTKVTDFEGYIIETEQEYIFFGITSGQQCCEYFGYLMCGDGQKEIESFIGAEFLSLECTDKNLLKTELFLKENYMHEDEVMFIDINTNKGTLQFTAYNQHNGKYGHKVMVFSYKKETAEKKYHVDITI